MIASQAVAATSATRAFQEKAQITPISPDSKLCIQLNTIVIPYAHSRRVAHSSDASAILARTERCHRRKDLSHSQPASCIALILAKVRGIQTHRPLSRSPGIGFWVHSVLGHPSDCSDLRFFIFLIWIR